VEKAQPVLTFFAGDPDVAAIPIRIAAAFSGIRQEDAGQTGRTSV
jgi:hypothetical protein